MLKVIYNKIGIPMTYERLDENNTRLTCKCIGCGRLQVVVVPSQGYYDWSVKGMMIQDAFPSLSPSQREMMLTGICDDCFP